MPLSVAICVIDENKSTEYRAFKKRLEKSKIEVKETLKAHRFNGNLYKDKLSTAMAECDAIVILCTESMKSYLNGHTNSSSELLQGPERLALQQGFRDYQNKVILISHDQRTRNDVVPNCVNDIDLYPAFYDIEQFGDIFDRIVSRRANNNAQ